MIKVKDIFKIREYRPGHWQIRFQFEGERVSLQKDDNGNPLDQRAAEHLAARLFFKGYDPVAFGKDKVYCFDRAIRTWAKTSECVDEWRTERIRIAEAFLIPFFKSRDFREIESVHIRNFQAELVSKTRADGKPLSSSYVRTIRNELRRFFKANSDVIPKMPEFKRMAFQRPVVKWLEEEDEAKVFSEIRECHLPIFYVLRAYPIRPGEICALKSEDVFMGGDIPFFLIRNTISKFGVFRPFTKTKKIRAYPILDELTSMFKTDSEFVFHRDGKPYTPKVLYDIWWKAVIKAGVPRVSLYSLKHAWGGRKLDEGFNIEDIRLLMGHTTAEMSHIYAKYSLGRMKEILEGISRTFPIRKSPILLNFNQKVENHPARSSAPPHGSPPL